MSKSRIFLYFCLALLAGVGLSSFITISQLWQLFFLIAGIFLISVFWRYKLAVLAGFCLLFLVFGIWRYQAALSKIIHPVESQITFTGIIAQEPDIREKNTQLTVEGADLRSGRVLITVNRYPEYHYGDSLRITGKLLTPAAFEDFNYKDYLAKDGIYSVMYWPKIEFIAKDMGNPVIATALSFKHKFQGTAEKFISPPQIDILKGLFSGDENGFSEEWKNKLNTTGTRHITAVSGMNITIIAFLIMSFAILVGFRRKQAFYFSIFLLTLYILMIGAPSSAVRAGIMAFLLMLAQYLGRLSAASRVVLFAATFMLLKNPLLLKFDIGFQLSFLAIMGLIYLQPIVFYWFRKIPDPKLFPARTTFSATVSAQFFTLPILIYNFGYIPLLSPITNLLIVPFLAPITILIFIFGISGMIIPQFGFLLSLPTWLSLTYIVVLIDWFAGVPWASLTLEKIHWAWLIAAYLILGCFVWRLNKKSMLKYIQK